MSPTSSASDHPSPHREKAHPVLLTATLMAGPTAWILQLLVSYGVSAYICQPRNEPRLGVPPAWSEEWALMLAVNLACVAGALAGAVSGLAVWRQTASEKPGPAQSLLEIGEGRARFLAACGIMSCCGFALAILFNTVEFFTIPACWRGAA